MLNFIRQIRYQWERFMKNVERLTAALESIETSVAGIAVNAAEESKQFNAFVADLRAHADNTEDETLAALADRAEALAKSSAETAASIKSIVPDAAEEAPAAAAPESAPAPVEGDASQIPADESPSTGE